jgi:adenylosuccinate synthase
MPAHVIVGSQWGDEGKGRIADWLAARADIVARYAGGDNAGHTVRVGEETFKLHIVPCGVIHHGVLNVMGGGMVINPLKLMDELRGLDGRGVDISPDRILLAETAHIITPAHVALDGADETQRGADAIGTTKRGIGPAYTDKAARTGLRAGLMRDPDAFAARVRDQVEESNRTLVALYGAEPVDPDRAAADLHAAAGFLAAYLADVPLALHRALEAGKLVLCEGAQGTLLDLDHGIYPYVTSSSPTVGGAISGLGIGPRYVERVIGVTKAYSTRVGEGPFPTELHGELGAKLRGTGAQPWDEYGTTTGRPRRCGWLDTVVVRYAARINGLTELAITKLDILSGFDQIRFADRYVCRGEEMDEMPTDLACLAACEPVYETLDGWQEDIMCVRAFEALPAAAQAYVRRIMLATGTVVRMVTVGPARDQTILPAFRA